MKKITAILLAISILAFAVYGNLDDYPKMFVKNEKFNAVIVVGNQAPSTDAISQSSLISFFSDYTNKPLLGAAKLSSEISSMDQNIISIGSPCDNPISLKIMGNPKTCNKGILPGKSIIKLFEYNGYSHMVIAGYDAAETRKAVNGLIDYKSIDFSQYEETEVEEAEKVDKIINDINAKIEENKKIEEATKADESVKAPVEEKPLETAAAENKTEEKQEKSIIKSIMDWLKSLFS
ncbi:MAG: hypothetical protein AABX00_01225 [Nanoarchaeota archaeon]